MPSSVTSVQQLRRGAEEARLVALFRLACLLDRIADLGQVVRDGFDPDANLALSDVIEYGVRVARDLCRDLPSFAEKDDPQ